MMTYFFAMLTLIASVPLCFLAGSVAFDMIEHAVKGGLVAFHEWVGAIMVVAILIVVAYADYHALQLFFGGSA